MAINNSFFVAGGLDEGVDMSKGAMGQRVLHDIKLETYTPRGECMYNTPVSYNFPASIHIV